MAGGNDYLFNKLQNQNMNRQNDDSYISKKVEQKDCYEIKKEIVKELNDIMSKINEEVDENFLKTTMLNLLVKYNIPEIQKKNLIVEILYDIKGYGILQPLLDDPEITEIICCRYDNIYVEKFGKMIKTNLKFNGEKELRNLIDKIIQPLGRRVDDAQPMVNARLKDKSRVNIVVPPIAADGATLDIRKFSKRVFTVEDYIKFGTMTKEIAELFAVVVTGRKT